MVHIGHKRHSRRFNHLAPGTGLKRENRSIGSNAPIVSSNFSKSLAQIWGAKKKKKEEVHSVTVKISPRSFVKYYFFS